MLNVLHVTAGISRQSAGVSAVLRDMVTHAPAVGIAPRIVTYTDEFFAIDRQGYGDTPVIGVPRRGPVALGFAPEMTSALNRLGDVNVVHVHGLWMLHGYYARRFAARRGLPLLISPHGMLEPWALRHSAWKKKLVRFLYENRNLGRAACLHAASRQEARHIRSLGIDNPIVVVPFGLDLTGYAKVHEPADLALAFPGVAGRRVLLFMSRIHPKKGVLDLAEAWGQLYKEHPDWCLVIAGPSELGHEAEVRACIARSGAERATLFVGPVHGERKSGLLALASLFVLPSYSENFGFVVAEALAAACPVITTLETPWEELPRHGCGWWIPTGREALQDALASALALESPQLVSMGEKGRGLVRRQYASETSNNGFANLYRWLAGYDAAAPENFIKSEY